MNRPTPKPRTVAVLVVALLSLALPGLGSAQVNAWVEGGFGVARAGHQPDAGARASVNFLYGNWGIQGRYTYVTPTRKNVGIGRDPDEEYREIAVLLERVLFEQNNAYLYVAAGGTQMSGFRYPDEGGFGAPKLDIEDEQGYTGEVGFRGTLARFVGVSGAVSVSPSNPKTLFLVSLGLRVGVVTR